jgi:hypothetical protein
MTNSQNVSCINFSSLIPLTLYQIYCFASLLDSTNDSFIFARNITTKCCKILTSKLSSIFFVQNQQAHKAIYLSVISTPSDFVSLKINISSDVYSFGKNNIFPSNFIFYRDSISFYSASLYFSMVGHYRYMIELSGPSATEYEIIYDDGSDFGSFSVLSANEEIPAPIISNAVFSDDGTYIIISFNLPTNKGNTENSFQCRSCLYSLVLIFHCVNGLIMQLFMRE